MMTDLFQPGQHPDADQLNAFVEHALPPQERDQTLAHLAVCPDCRAVVALSLPPLEELPRPQPVPERTPWFTGWRLAWPVTALAVSILLTIYLQRNAHRSINNNPPVQTATTSPPPQIAPQGSATPGPSPTPRSPAPHSPDPYSPNPRPAPPAAAALIQNLPVEARATTSPIAGQPSSAVLSAQPQSTRSAGLAMGSGSGVGLSSDAATMTAPAHAAAMAPSASGQFTLQLRSGAPATASSAEAPGAANSTVTIETSAAPMLDVESANTSAMIDSIGAEDSASLATVLHPLPGHHPVLSIAADTKRIVAIDTRHNLFFSDDAGRHWKKIRPEWSGSATRVALATSPPATPGPINGLMGGMEERRITGMSGAASTVPTLASNLVTGAVMDPTGAIIPGATVSVKDPKTGTLRSVTTGRDGRFLIAGLPPGANEVQASARGFQRLTTTVQVPPAGNVQTNLTLSTGSASQTITVESSAFTLAVVPNRKTANPQPNLFEITTDTGERWTSADGRTWQRK